MTSLSNKPPQFGITEPFPNSKISNKQILTSTVTSTPSYSPFNTTFSSLQHHQKMFYPEKRIASIKQNEIGPIKTFFDAAAIVTCELRRDKKLLRLL